MMAKYDFFLLALKKSMSYSICIQFFPVTNFLFALTKRWGEIRLSLQSGGNEMERIPLILLPVKSMSKEPQHLGLDAFF